MDNFSLEKNVHELYRKSLIVLSFDSSYSARFSNFKHYFLEYATTDFQRTVLHPQNKNSKIR